MQGTYGGESCLGITARPRGWMSNAFNPDMTRSSLQDFYYNPPTCPPIPPPEQCRPVPQMGSAGASKLQRALIDPAGRAAWDRINASYPNVQIQPGPQPNDYPVYRGFLDSRPQDAVSASLFADFANDFSMCTLITALIIRYAFVGIHIRVVSISRASDENKISSGAKFR